MRLVTESLMINGMPRLYWELLFTLSVHVVNSSAQYLEHIEHNQV